MTSDREYGEPIDAGDKEPVLIVIGTGGPLVRHAVVSVCPTASGHGPLRQ